MQLYSAWRPQQNVRVAFAPDSLNLVLVLALAVPLVAAAHSQAPRGPRALPPGPMIDGGEITLDSRDLSVELLKYSGTVARLSPKAETTLDYTPGDRLKERSADTFYHLGDLDLRIRVAGAATWTDVSTAFHRAPVTVVTADAGRFSGDVTSSLPDGTPLKVIRTWAVEGGDLVLRFAVTNTGVVPVEVGGVGIPMVFNNIMNGRTLDQSYRTCSFYDPYIGEDAGYVQVIRLNGVGPVLLVVPDGHTPFEEWKPILDRRDRETGKGLLSNDPTPRGTTFEGSYDWMVHSSAFAQSEWKGVNEWNPGTSQTLAPGESTTFGVRFFVAPDVRHIEATLAEHKRPVAVGIPGYILPKDIDARLFLRYGSPVRSIVSEPDGAVLIHDDGKNAAGLHAYTLRGQQWGRFRLVITYADGTVQSIGYRTIKPETEAIADMGRFLFHQQWFDDPTDPFHRGPSIISYDDEAGKQVRQDSRVWIAGLSDEAGAGSWLAAAMKEYLEPNAEEIQKLESFVDGVLWGHLQVNDGEHKYGVHKSLFFYQPALVPNFTYDPSLNWTSWTSWNKEGADDLGRSYNYPHVVSAYWALYRIARNTKGLAVKHPWDWYLNQAYETSLAMVSQAPYYTQFGEMEGTVFIRLLEDLKAEGWNDKAEKLEGTMRARADHWKTEPYPFGSEMPWDSTGQEEVYGWTRYFHFDDKADVTLNAILAYDPTIPSWGYNGSARRYWDFIYGGKAKYSRIERQLHHYGSGLNAIPLLEEYRAHPDDLYLLRVGYGGVMGPLSNIDEKGFASAAFHSFPDRMMFDPYSGDYGPNFFGHAVNTGTFLAHDDAMGWICFGGNVEDRKGIIHTTVLDSSRNRFFIAPLGLWITLDAGHLDSVDFDPKENLVRLHLAAASETSPTARLRLTQTTARTSAQPWTVASKTAADAGADVIPLQPGETVVTLRPKAK
ncbi:MAG: DUF5695 domain-containing protein [Terracidiphilus sp.]